MVPTDAMIDAAANVADRYGKLISWAIVHDMIEASLGATVTKDEAVLLRMFADELHRARAKHPASDNITTLALVEEVGEFAKALMEEPTQNVQAEGVQVAAMVLRLLLDGDNWVNAFRASRGLEPVGGGK